MDKPQQDDTEPKIFALSLDQGKVRLDRRSFIGLAAAAGSAMLGGCTPPKPPAPAPVKGFTKAGQKGINYKINGVSWTLPCGSPVPAGAVCTCNCVAVPAGTRNSLTTCTCNKVCTCNTVCSCVGHVTSHYWHPN